jgi:acyl-coenzyme A synthetase/AMP-(fatty) acid ligase
MQPESPALLDGKRKVSYQGLADHVLRTAAHLAALEVKRGDRVGICLRDDWQHVVVFLAVARLGAVAVQIDWRSRIEEAARVINAFAVKLALVQRQENVHATCRSVALDEEWNKAVANAEPATDLTGDWSAPLATLASSGTTGIPKFTLATHLQLYLHCAAYLEVVRSTRRQRFLLTLPLHFSAGRVACLAHLLRGDTLVFGPTFFTASEYLKIATRHQVTVGFIVPSVVRQLLSIAEPDQLLFPDIDMLASVGAPLFADEKREAWRKLTPRFHEMYGAAAIGPMAALRPEDIAERPTSVGRPFSFVDVEVVDDDDRPVGADTAGRLRCRGPGLTSPIAGLGGSREDFRDGWHYPGELAMLDSLGYIHLQGRTSEVIFRGGAKVFPAEVEAVLQAHEDVAEAAVVGRETPSNEQELIAYVVPRGAVSTGELLGHCRARLSAYKVPHNIYLLSELPRNSSGKLDKRALIDRVPTVVAGLMSNHNRRRNE